METVNSIAAAASKAIWGEPGTEKADANVAKTGNETLGEEPLSGVKGDVEKGSRMIREMPPETSTAGTDDVLASTKVLPLRPAGEAPATSEIIEDKTDKELPGLPSIFTPSSSSSDPVEKLIKPTPFVAGLKGGATSTREGGKLENQGTIGGTFGAGAGTAGVKGAGGQRLDEESLPAKNGESWVAGQLPAMKESASQSLSAEKIPRRTATPPAVPSKVSSENTSASTDATEGKEKLSLKDKIKAKLHHKH